MWICFPLNELTNWGTARMQASTSPFLFPYKFEDKTRLSHCWLAASQKARHAVFIADLKWTEVSGMNFLKFKKYYLIIITRKMIMLRCLKTVSSKFQDLNFFDGYNHSIKKIKNLRWLWTPCTEFNKTLPKVTSYPAYQNSVIRKYSPCRFWNISA